MAINTGFAESTKNGGDVVVRVYYDATIDPSQPQPLIDGPRGWCLDIKNVSGSNQSLTLTLPNGTARTFTVGQGDPVTTGASRSQTAVQMAALGFNVRSDISGFAL